MNTHPPFASCRFKRHVRRKAGSRCYWHEKAFDNGHSKPSGWRKTTERRRFRHVIAHRLRLDLTSELA